MRLSLSVAALAAGLVCAPSSVAHAQQTPFGNLIYPGLTIDGKSIAPYPDNSDRKCQGAAILSTLFGYLENRCAPWYRIKTAGHWLRAAATKTEKAFAGHACVAEGFEQAAIMARNSLQSTPARHPDDDRSYCTAVNNTLVSFFMLTGMPAADFVGKVPK